MRRHSIFSKMLFAFAGAMLACSISAAQNSGPSMLEQLKAQYKLVKTGMDANGLTIIDQGTVLEIKRGGLLGVPPASGVVCAAKFENGDLKAPNGFCAAMVKQQSRYLQVGARVYPTKIDVNFEKDKVSIGLMECDACNNVQQPSFYKSEVVFQFPKGALKNTGVPQVEDAIAKVLEISGDDGGGDSGQGNGNSNGNRQDQESGGAQQDQAPPKSIELGQTRDQVVNELGQPEKIVNLGAKQIYVYKDLKVTFVNGKVTDVQ